MKIKVTVMTNKVGSECSRIIEVDDEDEDCIDEIAQETMLEMINWDWEKV